VLVLAIVAAAVFLTPVKPSPSPSPLKAARTTAKTIAYADLELRFSNGVVSLVAVKKGRFAEPTALPLWRGRFIATVLKGKSALVELPFDFPLLADAESPADTTDEAHALSLKLKKGVTATTSVRVPLDPGADQVSIWDSASRKTLVIPVPGGD
jgi:hypothetical protein